MPLALPAPVIMAREGDGVLGCVDTRVSPGLSAPIVAEQRDLHHDPALARAVVWCPAMTIAPTPTVAGVFDAMTAARAGLERGLAQAASAAVAIAGGSGEPADLTRAAVDSLMAVRQVEASARAFERTDRALGTLLDLRA
jgi:hypothetical protein